MNNYEVFYPQEEGKRKVFSENIMPLLLKMNAKHAETPDCGCPLHFVGGVCIFFELNSRK